MKIPPHTTPLLPAPAFRVGVTGSRKLSAEMEAALTQQVSDVLGAIAGAFTGAAKLRILSPLAAGADRLVAQAARQAGWQIMAPLPFDQATYEADFPETVLPFRDLLASAQVLELDGDRSNADGAYEAVGRFVVRNCDLLIAVWDGEPGHRGGTEATMRFAARSNVPIWWLVPQGERPPVLLRGFSQMQHPARAPAGVAAVSALQALLHAAITPPHLPPPERHGIIGPLVGRFCHMAGRREHPLDDYLAEVARKPRMIWDLYAHFMNLIAPRKPMPQLPAGPLGAPTEIEAYWEQLGQPADLLSVSYGDRYRSCYILVFGLAAGALIAAGAGKAFEAAELAATLFELFFLGGIGVVVASYHLRRFHERWIACRLLAELCRKQKALAGLGWSLPHWEVERLSTDAPGHGPKLLRDAWVAWYFAAARRAAPLPQGRLDAVRVAQCAASGLTLAQAQVAYHEQRRYRSHLAASRLGWLGEVTFVATLLLVLIKLVPLRHHWHEAVGMIGFLTAFLPAASAAFVGIRAYAEFELLADQSARMQRELSTIAADLPSATPPGSLASQEVGAALFELSMAMLHDVRGWAQLFRMKSVEAG